MSGAAINAACAMVNLTIWAFTGSVVSLVFAGFSLVVALIFAVAES